MERFKHQKETFEATRDLPAFAWLWMMRCGKSFPAADTAIYLYEQKKIDAVIIVAPNGVHLNWARNVIPSIYAELKTEGKDQDDFLLEWNSSKSKTRKFQEQLQKAFDHQGLLWFCCNVEAVWTNALDSYLTRLVLKRRCLLIVDEAHKCKTPSSQCTKAVIRLSKACPYRRILTGTPATQGPFDLWSQFHILDPMILGPRFVPFKQTYGVFKRMRFGSGPVFDQLVEYKNLDKLYEIIKPYSSRLTQAEVFENLPELVHETRYFELSPQHRRVYNELKNELMATLESGEVLTAPEAIVQLIRLQQISRGFTGGIDDPNTTSLGKPYNSLTALEDIVEQVEGKIIVWCKFRADVELIHTTFAEKFLCVRYDGALNHEQRAESLKRFTTDPKVKMIVGTPAAGGIGVDMSAADTMIFYSHDYNLGNRLQAIARMQGPNQKSKSLLLIDLVAVDTTDEDCLAILDKKQDLAKILTGDKLREMLRK